MAQLPRTLGQSQAVQRLQDSTARALRQLESELSTGSTATAAPAPLSATLSSNFSGSSVTWEDVTGLSVTFTAVANERVLVCLAGWVYASGAYRADITLNVAGVDIETAGGGVGLSYAAALSRGAGFAYLTDALAAGSVTIKLRIRVDGGTSLVYAPARLSVIRLGCDW